MHTTTSVIKPSTDNIDNIINNNISVGAAKQNTRSSSSSPLSSCLPNTHGQTGARMISTLFSTAAGAPVMVSEASLQKAKLKYGSNNEDDYNDNNSNNINHVSVNSVIMDNRPNVSQH